MLERLSLRLESCAGSAITRVASSAQVVGIVVGGALIHGGLSRTRTNTTTSHSKRSSSRLSSQLRYASTSSSSSSSRTTGVGPGGNGGRRTASRYGYGSCPCTQHNFYLEFLYPRGAVRSRSTTIPKFPHSSTCSARTFRRYSTEAGDRGGRDGRPGVLEEPIHTEETDVQVPDPYEAYRIRADPGTLLSKPYDLQRHISACLDGSSYAMANDAWNKYRPPDMELDEGFFRDESVEGFFRFLGEIEPERSAGYASLSYALSDMFLERFTFDRLYQITNHMFETCDLIIQQFKEKGWEGSIRQSTYRNLLKCYGLQRRSRGLTALYEIYRQMPWDPKDGYRNIHEFNWMLECVLEAYCFLHNVAGMNMVCQDFEDIGKGMTREAYMLLLEDFGHRGDAKPAAAVLEQLTDEAPLDNAQPVQRLMQAYMRQKNTDAVLSIYHALEPLGLTTNTKVRHLVLFALVSKGDIKSAEALFWEFRKTRTPTASMFSALMLFYLKIKDAPAVERLFQEAKLSGVAMHASFRLRLLQVYAMTGNLKAAHIVLGDIIAQHTQTDMKNAWCDLLMGYMRHGTRREVEIIFEKMMAAGLITDKVYDLMIRYYTRQGLDRPAARIYLQLKRDGIFPSAYQLINIMMSRYRLRQALFGSKMSRQEIHEEHENMDPDRLLQSGSVRNTVGYQIERLRLEDDNSERTNVVASRHEAFARMDIILGKLRHIVFSFDLTRPVDTDSFIPLFEEAFTTLENGFLHKLDDSIIGAILFQSILDDVESTRPEKSILTLPILVNVMESFLRLKRYSSVQLVWQRILGLAYYYRPNRTEDDIKDDMHQNLLNTEALAAHEWPVPDRKSLVLDRFFYVLLLSADVSGNTFGLRSTYFEMSRRNYAVRTSTWNLLIRVLATHEPLYLSLRMAEDSLIAEEAYWGDQDLIRRGVGRQNQNMWLEEETIGVLFKMMRPFFELSEAPEEARGQIVGGGGLEHLKGDGIQRLLRDWENNFPRVYKLCEGYMKRPESGKRVRFM